MVTVRDPSGGVLTMYGKGTRSGSAFCFATRARQSLQHGCMGYLAYVVHTRVGEKISVSISDVPSVHDFHDVFPEELPGVPPTRQVEFQIHLIPGTTPIAKAPYCLAPPRMHELSSQLLELLAKEFIRPSNSL